VIKIIDDEQLQEMIDAQSWRKTNYIAPHEYFIRTQNPELFAEIARRVKEKPTKREFFGKSYRYYIFTGWRYWHYQIVLNRAKEEKTE